MVQGIACHCRSGNQKCFDLSSSRRPGPDFSPSASVGLAGDPFRPGDRATLPAPPGLCRPHKILEPARRRVKGNARGGARDLALHPGKPGNEHIKFHSLRGFASQDLMRALNEVYAIGRGTRCKHFLHALSLNPPKAARAGTARFAGAIERVEDRPGPCGQPRAIVFHEKEGRRHASCRARTQALPATALWPGVRRTKPVFRSASPALA